MYVAGTIVTRNLRENQTFQDTLGFIPENGLITVNGPPVESSLFNNRLLLFIIEHIRVKDPMFVDMAYVQKHLVM